MREIKGMHLASIRDGGQLIAAAVFMFGPTWAHYHLSACERSGNHLTNCLLQTGIERACDLGLKGLHLGGGRTTQSADTLLKFKLSLGGKLIDFKVAFVVVNQEAYAKLCRNWAKQTGEAPKWLLGYRQPMPSFSRDAESSERSAPSSEEE